MPVRTLRPAPITPVPPGHRGRQRLRRRSSALRLGQAGVDTLILETGRLWDTPDEDGKRFSKMLPADTRAGWFTEVPPSLVPSFQGISVDAVAEQNPSPQPVQAGICEKVTYGAHDVFRGIAVGGGSMVNAAIAAIPTPEQVHAAFPDIDPAEFLGTYVERAKATLRISYRDMDWFEQTPWFQYARVGRSTPRRPATGSTTTAAPTRSTT